MKRCPSCQHCFPEALAFCTDDATPLEATGVRVLADLSYDSNGLDPAQALRIALGLCEALDPARTQGRSPAPLTALEVELEGPDDRVRVTLSHETRPRRNAEAIDPSAPYMAPELFGDGVATPASTVYHIAALLFEALTGAPPFEASTGAALAVRKLLEEAPSPAARRTALPPRLDAIVTRALDRDPARRYDSPAALAIALREVSLAAASVARTPAVVATRATASSAQAAAVIPSSSARRVPVMVMGLCVLAAVAFGGVTWWTLGTRNRASTRHAHETPRTSPRSSLAPAPTTPVEAPSPTAPAAPGVSAATASQPPQRGRSARANERSRAPQPTRGRRADQGFGGTSTGEVVGTRPRESTTVAPPPPPAPPVAVVPQPSTRPDEAPSSRPWLLAGVGALVGVALTLFGLLRLRRRRAPTVSTQIVPVATAPSIPHTVVSTPTWVEPVTPSPLWQPTLSDAAHARTIAAPDGAVPNAVWCSRCGTRAPDEARFCPTDGADLRTAGVTVDPRASVPTRDAPTMRAFVVGQWRCESRLGEGGMGVVYRARHCEHDTSAAVKVLHLGGGNDAQLVARFRREARLAASVRHPNVVTIYEFGEVSGRLFFLAMELVEGSSLDVLLRGGAMPLPRVLELTRQVCACLEAAHAAGVVHRDLKPQNVMVRSDGPRDEVKLVDFGIARDLLSGERTIAGVIVGTPAYMAPEQARGEAGVDARADVFALAVMTYEMLTGVLPFAAEGTAMQQVLARATRHTSAPPASTVATWLPATIDAPLAQAMAANVQERTTTVRAFYEALAASAAARCA